jgi:hypothetical protein
VEPITLHDESTRPEWIRWEAPAKTGLLEGLVHQLASPTGFGASCTQKFEGNVLKAA